MTYIFIIVRVYTIIYLLFDTRFSGNTFVLQIQASQVDNPLKTAQARVEIEIQDLNDNLPDFEVDFYNISIVENLPNGKYDVKNFIKKNIHETIFSHI